MRYIFRMIPDVRWLRLLYSGNMIYRQGPWQVGKKSFVFEFASWRLHGTQYSVVELPRLKYELSTDKPCMVSALIVPASITAFDTFAKPRNRWPETAYHWSSQRRRQWKTIRRTASIISVLRRARTRDILLLFHRTPTRPWILDNYDEMFGAARNVQLLLIAEQ